MAQDTSKLGAAGEKAAARFLKRAGYRILAKNYACPAGEIDLICRDADTIVFVEVKTRRQDSDADPEINIHAHKRRKLTQVARCWIAAHRSPEAAYRFDAVSVVLPSDGQPIVHHIVEAFVPTEAW